MISLRRRLAGSLVKLLLCMGLLTGAASYVVAHREANELLDSQLRSVAEAIDSNVDLHRLPIPIVNDDDEDDELVMQVWDSGGALIRTSRAGFPMPRATASGFSVGDSAQGPWRVYSIVSSEHTVQVSQLEVVRREMAADAAFKALLPIILLLPLTCLVAWFGVDRILRPLRDVTAAAASRSHTNGQSLPEHEVPAEIAPMVAAVNELLRRLDSALESQRRFVSDAAHQLKTPLAALKLQIGNLRSRPAKEDFDSRMGDLEKGVDRMGRLVDQLLRLARQEAAGVPKWSGAVSVNTIVKESIASLLPLADQRRIDLGMVRDDPASVDCDPVDLRSLCDNLLDNAIRYSRSGGTVDVGIAAASAQAEIVIADSGPGLSRRSLARAFDRFSTAAQGSAEGTGLGLAIAKAIVERYLGTIELENLTDAPGLRVCAKLPLSSAPASVQAAEPALPGVMTLN